MPSTTHLGHDIRIAARAAGFNEGSAQAMLSLLVKEGTVVVCGWRQKASGHWYGMHVLKGRAAAVPHPKGEDWGARNKPKKVKEVKVVQPEKTPEPQDAEESKGVEVKAEPLTDLEVHLKPVVQELQVAGPSMPGGFYLGLAKAFEGLSDMCKALAER